ncbi:hypothetical protein CMI37_20325 [Candidatus Pacearchaeota archaeon]|nr:hypothetical protein [Candidatus Pacearchaeota archaeon]|tara:strand:+ start:6492 stop:6839 length:348 start_codon:yes stop_codon:yes gene_type:complete
MANTKLKTRAPFISSESLAMGATAESLATAGATVPGNAGEIWCFVPSGDSIHWLPNGTPTSTFGHAVAASNWFMLTHAQHGALIISDDGSDVTLLIVYMRGSGRQDAAYSVTAPY